MTSPEFTYLQIASKLDFIGTILAGSALCSDYFLNQNGHGGVSQRQNGPLTNRAAIAKFLATQGRKRGIIPAKRALQHIVEKARSPREASLALLLCLPYNLGGFNLGTVELNKPIELENRYGEKITRIPDLTEMLKSFESVQGLVRQIRESTGITARDTTMSDLEERQRELWARLFKVR